MNRGLSLPGRLSIAPAQLRPALLLAAGLALASPQTARAAGTFYVEAPNPACSDAGAGTSGQPYCTISAAVAARGGPGTRIVVRSGTYREQVNLGIGGDSTNTMVIEASGAATVDGADDLSAAGAWSAVGGGVWRASSVTWSPKQVFSGADRLAVSTAAPELTPLGGFRHVAGQGLYVNVGSGASAPASIKVGRRLHGFRLTAAPWIEIRGFTLLRTEDRSISLATASNGVVIADNTIQLSARSAIHVGNSSRVQILRNRVSSNVEHGVSFSAVLDGVVEGNECWLNGRPDLRTGSGLYLSGSNRNLIRNNRLHHNVSSGLYFQTAANDNVSIQNLSWDNGRFGYDHVGSTGTRHVGDVAWRNASEGFGVQGTSTGTTMHDCIAAENGTAANAHELWVDASSAAGFAADYNLYWKSSGKPLFRYAGVAYATLAALTAATGHESHGVNGDPRFVAPQNGDFHLAANSPAIDAATSSVAHWPALDADGRARWDLTGVSNTGAGAVAFADRGAFEHRPPNAAPVASLSVTPSSGVAPLAVSADASASGDADGTLASYRFDFGDGAVVGPQAGATASHVFAAGAWKVRVTVVDDGGLASTDSAQVQVAAPNQAPDGSIVSPAADLSIIAGESVTLAASGLDADGPGPLSYHWDLNGGAADSDAEDPGLVMFATPGTYTIRLTVRDGAGASDPTPATRVVQVGLAAPGGTADEIHWTFLSPTSVAFDWRGTASQLRFGTTTAYDRSVVSSPPNPMPFSSPGPFHEAVITGLEENTAYHYAIGAGSDHTFRTPPARGSSGFTIYVEGDIGSTLRYPLVAGVQALIAADPSDFCLLVGDLTYGDDHGPEAVDQHFNDMMVWSQDVAYMPAWGNHEWGSDDDDMRNYKGRFALPNPQASSGAPVEGCCGEDWYWFDYGNARFIAYPEPFSGAWAEWFVRADSLMDAVDADDAIDFIVTFGHRPAYSSGHHSGSSALANYLNSLGSAHPKYVLNLNGHSHDYERSHPQNGVVHVTAAGGGSSLEARSGSCKWEGGCPPPSWSAFRAMHHGPVKLRFTATGIEGTAICGPSAPQNDVTCTLGSAMDSFTIGVVGRDDLAPAVVAPAGVAATETQPVSFTVTASDPDGHAIATLTADVSGLPPGANAQFTPAADHASGVFTWTPGLGAGGQTYEISFTAGNALSGSATTAITVARANRTPDAVLGVTPSDGFAPLTVTADAFSSTDPEGPLASYRFDFGDGSVAGPQASPTATHTYGPGVWTARLRVTDASGAVDWDSVTVNALRNLVTNPSFESSTTGWNAYLHSTIVRVPGGVDGAWALEIRGPNTSAMFGLNDAPNWVSPSAGLGARYRYSAWVRSATGRGAVQLQIREFKNGVAFGATYRTAAVTLGADWREATGEYVVQNAGTTLDFQVIDFPSAPGEVFQVDRVVIYLVPPDRAPIVLAPSSVFVSEGSPVSFDVTAQDPDGEAIDALSADLATLPAGNDAVYEAAASQDSAHFSWTPDFSSAGTYTVTFTAANAREGAASTTITVLDVNRPPVIHVPASITIAEDSLLVLAVTTSDLDGEAAPTIAVEFEGFPLDHGAGFVPGPAGAGTLTWRPVIGHAGGPYEVEFTATNSMTTTADLMITVVRSNQAPTAALAALPSWGVAPAPITLAASGSVDPNGDTLSYHFDFGDGATQGPQAGATATHTYAIGAWTARVVVGDGHGGADTATTVVTALRNLVTNPSFETNTTGWNAYSGATIARVAGGTAGAMALQMTGPASTVTFGLNDSPNWSGAVPAAGTRYRCTAWVRSVANAGSARLQIREYLASVQQGPTVRSAPLVLSPAWQRISADYVTLVTGSTLDFQILDFPVANAERFLADDVSIVIVPPGLESAASAQPAIELEADVVDERWAPRPLVVPNPLRLGGVLRFGTSVEGPLRVDLFDMQGRRLRTVADRAHLMAGNHTIPIEARREDGRGLAAGVYFYRVENAHGTWSGRFLVVK